MKTLSNGLYSVVKLNDTKGTVSITGLRRTGTWAVMNLTSNSLMVGKSGKPMTFGLRKIAWDVANQFAAE